jgi:hypothetical protein
MHGRLAALTALALGLAAAACGGGGGSSQPPTPDMMQFQALVYPVLLRDCAFNNCHGSPERFFQVLGPGRTRRDPMLDASELDPIEVQFSYERTRSMLSMPVTSSLLLLKPLEAKVGGVGHRGADHFGRNVYLTKQDAGYVTLLQWAQATTAAATPPAMTPGMH